MPVLGLAQLGAFPLMPAASQPPNLAALTPEQQQIVNQQIMLWQQQQIAMLQQQIMQQQMLMQGGGPNTANAMPQMPGMLPFNFGNMFPLGMGGMHLPQENSRQQ